MTRDGPFTTEHYPTSSVDVRTVCSTRISRRLFLLFFLLLFSVAQAGTIIYWRPSYRFPKHGRRQGGRRLSLCVQAAQRNDRRATCMHFHTAGNSVALSTFFACSRNETLLIALDIAVKAFRYTTYILVPGSACKSVCWHHFSTKSCPLTKNGWSGEDQRQVIAQSGCCLGVNRTISVFLQFQLAWLSNNKSCYWHPELFLLGAGRLRNGRCLQGSGTQGSLLLTGAKKPEIALPTERCTISRQQRRERNGFRYKT